MNTSLKASVFRTMLVLFGVVALISSSVAPAFAERDAPGKPMDLQKYCASGGFRAIIDPLQATDPDGRSWRCAKIDSYEVTVNGSTSCSQGLGVEVSVTEPIQGTFSVECTDTSGVTVHYTASQVTDIDIDAACQWLYRWWDRETGQWMAGPYVGDSWDWSNPKALNCYPLGEF